MVPWKRIGVVLKAGRKDMAPLLERVVAALREHALEVVLEPEAASQVAGSEGLSLEDAAARADLFIVLGGDGTVLATARAIGERPVPILGINLGQLGFLTDVHAAEIDAALAALFDGRCEVRERARLEVTSLLQDGERRLGLALNDAVISTGSEVARLINLETRVDGRFVASYLADGLVVSTPTGSTAYNLSAGGPLVDPTVSAMLLTPICPHTLSQRPLVLSSASTVEVRLGSGDDVHVTLDGQVGLRVRPGEGIRVTRSRHPARFLALPEADPFETLRTKLGWGSR